MQKLNLPEGFNIKVFASNLLTKGTGILMISEEDYKNIYGDIVIKPWANNHQLKLEDAEVDFDLLRVMSITQPYKKRGGFIHNPNMLYKFIDKDGYIWYDCKLYGFIENKEQDGKHYWYFSKMSKGEKVSA